MTIIGVLLCTEEFMLLLCRAMGDVSDRIGRPTDNGQVCVH